MHKPGSFAPGEAEKVAANKGMTLLQFFWTLLMVEYWFADDRISRDVNHLTPAIVGHKPGTTFPFNPLGTCIFLKDGLCSIHEVKPLECSMAHHSMADDAIINNKVHVVKQWNTQKNQKQIEELLGAEE